MTVSHVGTLTITTAEPDREVYTLADPHGRPIADYVAVRTNGGGWRITAPDGTDLGIEPDGPEVAMAISLHAMPARTP